uniref:Histone acetyltransferase type B catalytic subunit n=1 Tax=Strongyloides stercoralis TaxID=6248 RepID=A0A0K0E8A1_STRER
MATIPDDVLSGLQEVLTSKIEERLLQQQKEEEEMAENSQKQRSFTQEEEEWVSNAVDVIKFHMVESSQSLEDTPGYPPIFVHQFFPDEKIFGYKDLKIDIYFCASTMYFYPIISYTSTSKEIVKTMEPDDILERFCSELPDWHMEVYKKTRGSFEEELKKQIDFKPYGEVVYKFTNNNESFELWGQPKEFNKDFNDYVTRIQFLALFEFETGDYTDMDDEGFLTYILYSVKKKSESDDLIYSVAGYASVYRYYVYPENEKRHYPKVVDITIEDPSDDLIYCRDYVDLLTLKDQPEFSEEKVKAGFSKEMEKVGREKYKINPRQTRRIYEILRLHYTDESNKDELKAYRIDVKRRLEKPMKRTKKEINRLSFLAAEDKHYLSVLESNNPEVKQPQLQRLYEKQIDEYKCVLNRLKKYENF